jgi:hypothetical protein
MHNPQFAIKYDDVTAYIISLAQDDGPITADLLSSVLSWHIGYAGNTDLECMVVLYSLLRMDILPPIGLRTPIKRMLYSHNGEDLNRHLVDILYIESYSERI